MCRKQDIHDWKTYCVDGDGWCGDLRTVVATTSLRMDCLADCGDVFAGGGVCIVDGGTVSVGGVVCGDGAGAAVGDARALFEDSESDLCVWVVRDCGGDSIVWAADRAAGICVDYPDADLADEEGSGGARGGVWRGVSEVSGGDVVLKHQGLKPHSIFDASYAALEGPLFHGAFGSGNVAWKDRSFAFSTLRIE